MLAKHVRNINAQHNSKQSATFLLLASCKCFCWTTNFFLDPKLRKTWKRQIEFVRHKTSIEMKKEKITEKSEQRNIKKCETEICTTIHPAMIMIFHCWHDLTFDGKPALIFSPFSIRPMRLLEVSSRFQRNQFLFSLWCLVSTWSSLYSFCIQMTTYPLL